MDWHNKNLGKSPFDPDYIDEYDSEADYERYCEEQEMLNEVRRGK